MATHSRIETRGRSTGDFLPGGAQRTKSKLCTTPEKQLKTCSGCQWQGKSLRGHLRANSACQKYYNMDALKSEAEKVKKKQRAEWESANRIQRTKRMKKKKPPCSPKLINEASETQQKRCNGCQWIGKSLRCHLRGSYQCHTFYDLDQLEREAKEAKKVQYAKWEMANRKERTERMKKYKATGSPKTSSYVCNVCDKSFTFRTNLDRHNKDVHKELKKFTCGRGKCPKKFSRNHNFRRHVKGHYNKIKSSEGAYVPTTKKDKAPSTSRKPLIRCKGCQWQGKSLRGHLRARSPCQKFYDMDLLEQCAKEVKKNRQAQWESSNRKKRTERMKQMKANPSTKSSTHTCNICDRVFSFKSALDRHISDVHKELKRFPCPKCPQYFSRQVNMQRHLDRGKHLRTRECYQCKETIVMKKKSDWDKHFLKDGLTCAIASARIKAKENEMASKGKQSVSSQSAKEHSNNQPSFPSVANTTALTTQNSVESETETNCHVCSHCGEKFSEKFNLKRHQDDVHKELKRFKCNKCPKEFSRLHNLKRHQYMESHLLPFKCCSCEEELFFKTEGMAERHSDVCSVKKRNRERREKRRQDIEKDLKKLEEFKNKSPLWNQLTEDQRMTFEDAWKTEKITEPSFWNANDFFWHYEEAIRKVREQVRDNQLAEVEDFKRTDEWKNMSQELKEELQELWRHFRGRHVMPKYQPFRYATAEDYDIDEGGCYDCIEGYPWWKEVLEIRRKEMKGKKATKKN